ncbi:hypothetical protein OX283_013305 [Flavobacterium sp. SUN052]|uniref:hypothetical protein n=1 Tax=Flavobacterium sp. SUN052 TaxID=3002441 RepID=UPI00237D338B|nr:hypothetical protein [Flavobacterium sp. SUN052]MEC4005641.1 hypothetical protein [Flavobacterium sp. SUN052]
MKKSFALLFVLIFSFSALSQTKATAFPDAGFMAAFPSKPQVEKNQVDTKAGKIETTSYNCEGEDFLIVLSESVYPSDLVKKLDGVGIQGILDGAKNGAVKNIEAQMGGKITLTTDENFLYDGKYAATKFGGKVEEVDMETVCIMKENHFFIVMLVGNTKSEIATQFIKSFQLIEKK